MTITSYSTDDMSPCSRIEDRLRNDTPPRPAEAQTVLEEGCGMRLEHYNLKWLVHLTMSRVF